MKQFLFLIIFYFLACGSNKHTTQGTFPWLNYEINPDRLQEIVFKLADPKFEGRKTGEEGQKLAAGFIADYYQKFKIPAPEGEDYFQKIPLEFFQGYSNAESENVWAWIEGAENPEEVLVISAHYDHLGKKGVEFYPGADDDASGTAAVMEIARLFQKAKNEGNGPKRSILFLHVTGEESGLYGSKYYTSHPIFSLEKTVANLNIDMIGRRDNKYKNDEDYVYLIGSDKLSEELHLLSENVNKNSTKLIFDYTFNSETDPNRFYYRSDHYNFSRNNFLVIFYFNGTHADYHRITDTPDKIDYPLLGKRAQLIFNTAWEIANLDKPLALNSKE